MTMIQPVNLDPGSMESAATAAEADALLAASTFGGVLHASPEYMALVQAGETMQQDREAMAAIEAFGRRQAELRMQAMLGTLDASQQAELERLQTAMIDSPSVAAYLAAQEAFGAVCRETAVVISAQIGIDFAASCRSGGCCG
jgi:cell fate (sporulation/competence/biofilm development) regulator YlbF (YheA/YmcA/DUF963 family)